MIQRTVNITEEQDRELQLLANQEMDNYSSVLRDVLRVGLVITSNGVIEPSAIRMLEIITSTISRTEIDRKNPGVSIWRGISVLLEHNLIRKGVDEEGNIYFRPFSDSIYIGMDYKKIEWD